MHTATRAGLHAGKIPWYFLCLLAGAIMATAPLAEPRSGVITGSVADAATGLGIEGARASLPMGLETLAAMTDSAGKFLLEGIPEGTGFPVTVEKTGYHAVTVSVTVTSSKPAAIAVRLTDVFLSLLSPAKGYLIAGTDVEIRWDAVGVEALRIEFSPNGGRSWMLVAPRVDAAGGVWVWQVPDIPATEGYIRITDTARPLLFSRNAHPLVISST